MMQILGTAQILIFDENTNSGKNTHRHEGYKAAFKFARKLLPDSWDKNPDEQAVILDLFARKCPWGTIRNDLNIKFLERGYTNVCKDANECLLDFQADEVDLILLDPPFSDRMAADKYDQVGRANLYTDPRYMSCLGKQMFRVLTPGGLIVKAGFNSNKPCDGLIMRALFISRYGACRNDVLFTVWQKTQTTLDEY